MIGNRERRKENNRNNNNEEEETSQKENVKNSSGVNWLPLIELALHFDNQKQKLQYFKQF